MPARSHSATIYVAKESFTADIDGAPRQFKRGQTTVREGHPVLESYRQYFRPMEVDYDVEDATADPGVRRGER